MSLIVFKNMKSGNKKQMLHLRTIFKILFKIIEIYIFYYQNYNL